MYLSSYPPWLWPDNHPPQSPSPDVIMLGLWGESPSPSPKIIHHIIFQYKEVLGVCTGIYEVQLKEIGGLQWGLRQGPIPRNIQRQRPQRVLRDPKIWNGGGGGGDYHTVVISLALYHSRIVTCNVHIVWSIFLMRSVCWTPGTL